MNQVQRSSPNNNNDNDVQRQHEEEQRQRGQQNQNQQNQSSNFLHPDQSSYEHERQKQKKEYSSSFFLNNSQSRQLDNRKVQQWRELSELGNPVFPLTQIKLNLFYILKHPQLTDYFIEILALRAEDDQISTITQKYNEIKRQYNDKLLNKELLNSQNIEIKEKFDEFLEQYQFCNQLKHDILQSSKQRNELGQILKIAVQQLANIKDKSNLQQQLILQLVDKKKNRMSDEAVEAINKLRRQESKSDGQKVLVQILDKIKSINVRNIQQIKNQTQKGLKLAEEVKVQMQNIVESYQEQNIIVEGGQNSNSDKKQHLTIQLARLLKQQSQNGKQLKQLKLKTLYPLKQQLYSLENLKKEKERQIKDLNTRKEVLQNQNIVWNQNEQLQQNSTSEIIKQINQDQQGLIDTTLYVKRHRQSNINHVSSIRVGASSSSLLRNGSLINNPEMRQKPISVVKKNVYEKPLEWMVNIWIVGLCLFWMINWEDLVTSYFT